MSPLSVRMNENARQVPVQVLIEAIKNGIATPDPQGGSGTMYYIDMVRNGTTYTLEVLYDKTTNMIQHFMYYHKYKGIGKSSGTGKLSQSFSFGLPEDVRGEHLRGEVCS